METKDLNNREKRRKQTTKDLQSEICISILNAGSTNTQVESFLFFSTGKMMSF